MARPSVASTLIGARRVAQLEGNLAAADLALTADQTARPTEAGAPAAGFTAGLVDPAIRHMVFGGNDFASRGDLSKNGSD